MENGVSIVEDEKEMFKYWRIYKTLMQLCSDREYIVTHAELNQTLPEFKAQFGPKILRDDLTFVVEKISDASDKMIVLFPEECKINMPTIKHCYKTMRQENVSRALIVVRTVITKLAKQALSEMAPAYSMEYFLEAELMVNVTDHELVPKHTRLTSEEKEELLQRLKAQESQIPRIQLDDPIVRYYGFERSQIIKIDRPSDTAGRYIHYRVVI